MLLLYVFGWVLNIGQVREEIDLIFFKEYKMFFIYIGYITYYQPPVH